MPGGWCHTPPPVSLVRPDASSRMWHSVHVCVCVWEGGDCRNSTHLEIISLHYCPIKVWKCACVLSHCNSRRCFIKVKWLWVKWLRLWVCVVQKTKRMPLMVSSCQIRGCGCACTVLTECLGGCERCCNSGQPEMLGWKRLLLRQLAECQNPAPLLPTSAVLLPALFPTVCYSYSVNSECVNSAYGVWVMRSCLN